MGHKTLQEAWDLYQKKDWKLQKQYQSDFVYSRIDQKGKKIFKIHVSRKHFFLLLVLTGKCVGNFLQKKQRHEEQNRNIFFAETQAI